MIFPSCTHCHFNPRTREGCDYSPRFVSHFGRIISIHAPARGATPISYFNSSTASISIHAPARGATSDRVQRARAPRDFNPRTREGCDVSCLKVCKISIKYFNPRTREGCDTNASGVATFKTQFQSTHPRGVRPLHFVFTQFSQLFQSTHPRGVRLMFLSSKLMFANISIHAPARGATLGLECWTSRLGNFNPRTREGCDFLCRFFRRNDDISIHAPARGATLRKLRMLRQTS